MTTIKTYSELITLDTFEDRLKYLKLNGTVGSDTFGYDRWINQNFYKDKRWRSIRDKIIIRDNACDLGISGYDIYDEKIIVHHMNPIRIEDIEQLTPYLLNPEYLICTTQSTHNAIHYGDSNLIVKNEVTERKPNDTCPWKI